MDLGLKPSFLGGFQRRHGFADGTPSVIELADNRLLSDRGTTTTTKLCRLICMRPFRRGLCALRQLRYRSWQEANLDASIQGLRKHRTFFIRQSDKPINDCVCGSVISTLQLSERCMGECVDQSWRLAGLSRIVECLFAVNESGLGITVTENNKRGSSGGSPRVSACSINRRARSAAALASGDA
jgi:hypothetical protein